LLKIAHRINTIQQLENTPIEYGVELDLRPDKPIGKLRAWVENCKKECALDKKAIISFFRL